MKKVLVTGASGSIGLKVIKYLLSEGKYEITALDLRNKGSQKRLKKYRRRINIIYGDINDTVLIPSLIKDQDYIIHLAGVMPPIADLKKGLSDLIEYNGTLNIIKALDFYNPKCFLVYASSTTIYGDIKTATIKSKPNILPLDYYSTTKLATEDLIKSKLKNYTIIRLPFILSDPSTGSFMYNVKRNTTLEALTDNDAAYLFVNSLNHEAELRKKTFNAGGGDTTTSSYRDILSHVLEIYGISFKYLGTLLFLDKNFYSHIYEDSDKLNDILEFRSDSLSSYYMRLKRSTKNRLVAKFLAKPFIFFLRRKVKWQD